MQELFTVMHSEFSIIYLFIYLFLQWNSQFFIFFTVEFSNFYPHYIHMHMFQIPFKFRSKKGGILDGETQIWPMLSKQQRPIIGSQSH